MLGSARKKALGSRAGLGGMNASSRKVCRLPSCRMPNGRHLAVEVWVRRRLMRENAVGSLDDSWIIRSRVEPENLHVSTQIKGKACFNFPLESCKMFRCQCHRWPSAAWRTPKGGAC